MTRLSIGNQRNYNEPVGAGFCMNIRGAVRISPDYAYV